MAVTPAPPSAVSAQEPSTPSADAEELFQTYSRQLYRYCLGRLGSPEEADDAVQITYLNAWRSLQQGTHPVEPRPWLFAIAANVCATALRSKLRGAKIEVRAPEDFERLPGTGTRSDDLVDLDAALRALPARQRHALLLRDWRGLSYEEIAAELDASQPAVETLLFRARQAVADSLSGPTKRVRSVPVRSALSTVVLWPSGLKSLSAALKSSLGNAASSLPGGAPAAKAAVVAIGAISPLLAYGVLERSFGREGGAPEARPAATAPALTLDTPGGGTWPPAWHSEGARSVAGTDASPVRRSAGGRSGNARAGGTARGSAIAGIWLSKGAAVKKDPLTPGGLGGDSSPGTQPAPSKPPQASAPKREPKAGRVVICQQTGSKKNPGVTITVSQWAVEAHLAHGDALGPCAG